MAVGANDKIPPLAVVADGVRRPASRSGRDQWGNRVVGVLADIASRSESIPSVHLTSLFGNGAGGRCSAGTMSVFELRFNPMD